MRERTQRHASDRCEAALSGLHGHRTKKDGTCLARGGLGADELGHRRSVAAGEPVNSFARASADRRRRARKAKQHRECPTTSNVGHRCPHHQQPSGALSRRHNQAASLEEQGPHDVGGAANHCRRYACRAPSCGRYGTREPSQPCLPAPAGGRSQSQNARHHCKAALRGRLQTGGDTVRAPRRGSRLSMPRRRTTPTGGRLRLPLPLRRDPAGPCGMTSPRRTPVRPRAQWGALRGRLLPSLGRLDVTRQHPGCELHAYRGGGGTSERLRVRIAFRGVLSHGASDHRVDFWGQLGALVARARMRLRHA